MQLSGRRRRITNERWREIPKSNRRYFISNLGRIKSYAINTEEGEIMKGTISNGYKVVQLNCFTRLRKFYVHKLVAEVWLERPSKEHTVVIHLDHNNANNKVSNLKWLTKKEFLNYYGHYLRELHSRPDVIIPKTSSKLKYDDIVVLKSMIQKGESSKLISQFFCISISQVQRIKRGENWGYVKPTSI
jgi:hypothetical protein